MKFIISLLLLCTSIVQSVTAGEMVHQSIDPAKSVYYRMPDEVYVTPSSTRKLKPGERVDVKAMGEYPEWVIQRLTDRTYWMFSRAFAVTVFVGDEGILTVDAPDSLVADDFFAALKRISNLPLRAVVFSHPHPDHIAGVLELTKASQARGIDLRVIGSQGTAKELRRYGNNFGPNEVLPDGRATFRFEKWAFKLVTPVDGAAHSDADSYILTPDRVIHYADFNYPGRLPLAYISVSRNISGWIEFLRHALGEEWDFANLGHSNIGYKSDILMTFDYLRDLYEVYFTEIAPMWASGEAFPKIVTDENMSAAVFWGNFVEWSSEFMAQKMLEKWDETPAIEVIRSHAYQVFQDAFVNYFWKGNHEIRPNFDPISPLPGKID